MNDLKTYFQEHLKGYLTIFLNCYEKVRKVDSVQDSKRPTFNIAHDDDDKSLDYIVSIWKYTNLFYTFAKQSSIGNKSVTDTAKDMFKYTLFERRFFKDAQFIDWTVGTEPYLYLRMPKKIENNNIEISSHITLNTNINTILSTYTWLAEKDKLKTLWTSMYSYYGENPGRVLDTFFGTLENEFFRVNFERDTLSNIFDEHINNKPYWSFFVRTSKMDQSKLILQKYRQSIPSQMSQKILLGYVEDKCDQKCDSKSWKPFVETISDVANLIHDTKNRTYLDKHDDKQGCTVYTTPHVLEYHYKKSVEQIFGKRRIPITLKSSYYAVFDIIANVHIDPNLHQTFDFIPQPIQDFRDVLMYYVSIISGACYGQKMCEYVQFELEKVNPYRKYQKRRLDIETFKKVYNKTEPLTQNDEKLIFWIDPNDREKYATFLDTKWKNCKHKQWMTTRSTILDNKDGKESLFVSLCRIYVSGITEKEKPLPFYVPIKTLHSDIKGAGMQIAIYDKYIQTYSHQRQNLMLNSGAAISSMAKMGLVHEDVDVLSYLSYLSKLSTEKKATIKYKDIHNTVDDIKKSDGGKKNDEEKK